MAAEVAGAKSCRFFVPFLQMFNMKRDNYETQKSFVYAVEPYQVAG